MNIVIQRGREQFGPYSREKAEKLIAQGTFEPVNLIDETIVVAKLCAPMKWS